MKTKSSDTSPISVETITKAAEQAAANAINQLASENKKAFTSLLGHIPYNDSETDNFEVWESSPAAQAIGQHSKYFHWLRFVYSSAPLANVRPDTLSSIEAAFRLCDRLAALNIEVDPYKRILFTETH